MALPLTAKNSIKETMAGGLERLFKLAQKPSKPSTLIIIITDKIIPRKQIALIYLTFLDRDDSIMITAPCIFDASLAWRCQ